MNFLLYPFDDAIKGQTVMYVVLRMKPKISPTLTEVRIMLVMYEHKHFLGRPISEAAKMSDGVARQILNRLAKMKYVTITELKPKLKSYELTDTGRQLIESHIAGRKKLQETNGTSSRPS